MPLRTQFFNCFLPAALLVLSSCTRKVTPEHDISADDPRTAAEQPDLKSARPGTDTCTATPATEGIRVGQSSLSVSPQGSDVIDLTLSNMTECTGYSDIHIRISWLDKGGKQLAYSTYLKEKKSVLPPGVTRQYTIRVGDHVAGTEKIESVVVKATAILMEKKDTSPGEN